MRVAITGLPLCRASETFTSKPSRVESWRTMWDADKSVLRSWSLAFSRMTDTKGIRSGNCVSRASMVWS